MRAISTTERLGNYLEVFGELGKRNAEPPTWLRSLREGAFSRFCRRSAFRRPRTRTGDLRT